MAVRPQVRSQTRSQRRKVDEPVTQAIPGRADLIMLMRPDGAGGVVDSIGVSSRPVQPLQNMTGGTLTHVDLTGNETVVSNGGTGSVAVSTGTLTITGTVWDIELSNGWLVVFANSTLGIAWNVSGPNLISNGVVSGASLTDGSDWLNQYGYTVATGQQYLNEVSFGLIPPAEIIPARRSVGCCALEVANV